MEHDEVRLILLDPLRRMRAHLNARTARLNKLQASSKESVDKMPLTADGEVYLHNPYSELWANKIVAFNPKDRSTREIVLPQEMSMLQSEICQISSDIYQF